MNDYQKYRVPYGFSFLGVEQTKTLQDKTRKAQQILLDNNYQRVMPSTLDYPETFQDFENYDSFQLRDGLGQDLALRNDVTVQVIKGFSNQMEVHEKSSDEIDLYYTVPVFKDIKRSYPTFREVYQIGAESIGVTSEKAVLKHIKIAHRILTECFDEKPIFLIGDIQAFQLFQKEYNDIDLREIIRNKDSYSFTEILNQKGWTYQNAMEFSHLMLFSPEIEEWNERWNALLEKIVDPKITALMKKLENIFNNFSKEILSLNENKISIHWEPFLIRKTEYYTGLIYEGYIRNLSFPPLRGGTYDNLVNEYSNSNMPASGFALDVSSIV